MLDVGPKVVFTIPLLKGIPVTDTVVVTWVIMAALIVLLIIFNKILGGKLKEVPKGLQNYVEWMVDALSSLAKQIMGKRANSFIPYFGTVAIFLMVANIMGVFGFRPPTRDLSLTAALAIMTILLSLGANVRFNGAWGCVKSFFQPAPFLVFMNILDLFTRPLSLAVRLYGNIIAGVIMMDLIYKVAPLIIPGLLSIYFDFFDGFIQMLVFVFLSMIYVSEPIKEEQ